MFLSEFKINQFTTIDDNIISSDNDV